MKVFRRFAAAVVFIQLIGVFSAAFAFGLRPESEIDGKIKALAPRDEILRFWDQAAYFAVNHFSHPVHERITNLIWGCQSDDDCNRTAPGKSFAPGAAIAGVRWNDNPPFELTDTSMKSCTGRTLWLPNYSNCWLKLYKDGEKRAKRGATLDLASGTIIMLRSHFGDLQFLHSMAAGQEERAGETQGKILMWAELTWRVARKEFGLGTKLSETNIPQVENYFKGGETVQTLFTRGNPTHRENIDILAFGALLHTVEDSFSRSHVDRDEANGQECGPGMPKRPGAIRQFLNYALQDSSLHAVEDEENAFDLQLVQVRPNAVDVGQSLKAYLDRGAAWEEVKPYLECVFAVTDMDKKTGSGGF
ncbi:hypothetical protein [Herbaspirillum sp. RV1423]|uniref:hypothetical protein n=1 Tax=Herbaspirillum sp. RV1423 TaxID=1443993 RepID=UPI0004B7630E|nr:hypothetical protein [Herbaspirillum sp. RV1423]